jgi:hypothetical protein
VGILTCLWQSGESLPFPGGSVWHGLEPELKGKSSGGGFGRSPSKETVFRSIIYLNVTLYLIRRACSGLLVIRKCSLFSCRKRLYRVGN